MSISAVSGCVPIKPQVSFGSVDFSKSDKINDTYVKSSDIKSPVAIGGSLALAMFASAKTGKGLTNLITSRNFAQNAGVKFENGVNKAFTSMSEQANKLKEAKGDGILTKVKHGAGKTIETIERALNYSFEKVAYSFIKKDSVNPQRANEALGNVVGAATATGVTCDILTKDSNGDGVCDIMQKSQNAYTGSKNTYESTSQILGLISDVAEVVA